MLTQALLLLLMTGLAAAVPAEGAGLYELTGENARKALAEFTEAAICDWSNVGMSLAGPFFFFYFFC